VVVVRCPHGFCAENENGSAIPKTSVGAAGSTLFDSALTCGHVQKPRPRICWIIALSLRDPTMTAGSEILRL
jgi:hypothetical protein